MFPVGSTNPLSWSSRKRVIARSSTEAEYRALITTASKTLSLTSLLSEHGFKLSVVPTLLCYNLAAMHLSFNPMQHSKMNYIRIEFILYVISAEVIASFSLRSYTGLTRRQTCCPSHYLGHVLSFCEERLALLMVPHFEGSCKKRRPSH